MTSGRRTLMAAIAVAVLSTASVVVPASAHKGHAAKKHGAAGVMYGGFTPQGWPVVLHISADRRQLVKSDVGFDMKCQAGDIQDSSDIFTRVPIHANRKLSASYTNVRVNNDDGTFDLWSGSIRGVMNRAQTSFSGTARLAFTEHAANGPITGSCDSGTVKFKVQQ